MSIRFVVIAFALVFAREASAKEFSLPAFLRHSSQLSLLKNGLKADELTPQEHCEKYKLEWSCLDCHTLIYCFSMPTGGWIPDPTKCADEETCIAVSSTPPGEAKCSTEPNPNPECDTSVSNYKFECYQKGTFPHAYDCTKYYICQQTTPTVITPIEMDCEEGFAFDPLTTLCSKIYVPDGCDRLTEPCERVGFQGPVPNNPYMYWVCLNTEIAPGNRVPIPQFFNCLGGKHYVPETRTCEDPMSGENVGDMCAADNDFYDPSNCRNYIKCVKDEEAVLTKCPDNEKFDAFTRKCVPYC